MNIGPTHKPLKMLLLGAGIDRSSSRCLIFHLRSLPYLPIASKLTQSTTKPSLSPWIITIRHTQIKIPRQMCFLCWQQRWPHFQSDSSVRLSRTCCPGYKKHLVFLHSFIVNVKFLFTVERLATVIERNHVLPLQQLWTREIKCLQKSESECRPSRCSALFIILIVWWGRRDTDELIAVPKAERFFNWKLFQRLSTRRDEWKSVWGHKGCQLHLS